MIKYILLALATLSLAACDGLSVNFDNDHFKGSYSAKGGLVVSPQVIRIIEPAK